MAAEGLCSIHVVDLAQIERIGYADAIEVLRHCTRIRRTAAVVEEAT